MCCYLIEKTFIGAIILHAQEIDLNNNFNSDSVRSCVARTGLFSRRMTVIFVAIATGL